MVPQFDVFLSHSSIDKPWVIKLKDDLLRYGVSVWLDKDEIRPGDLFGKALEQALDNCRAVALIVSPQAISSGWVEEEYYRALSLAKAKQASVQIIPVVLREAELYGFLQGRNWVDFRDESAYAQSVWKLVWGITGEKPAQVLDLSPPDLSTTSTQSAKQTETLTANTIQSSDLPEKPQRSARILVVDDRRDWRTTLNGLLVDEGYQVTTAKNEAEALSAAVQTSFEMAIIDVCLRGDDAEEDESGILLALALKKVTPQMKVILQTGQPVRTELVVKSIRFFGVANFIEKSKLEETLVANVEKILSEPSFESEPDRLSLSLEPDQPIVMRSRGTFVYALRTSDPLQISVTRYNRRSQEARAAPDPVSNIKVLGKDLYRDIFKNCQDVLVTFTAAKTKSQPLCLSFEGIKDFIGIPLEFIFLDQPEEYLVFEHPITRFINGVIPKRKALSPQIFAQLKEKLRVLIIASNTDPSIPGVDQETQQLADFLKSQQYVNVEVDLIPTKEATISHVRQKLKGCRDHILHYAGHVWYDEAFPEKSKLSFWSQKNRKGAIEVMSVMELKGLLQDTKVRFAYFSSCYGTTTDSQSALLEDDFLGIADTVIQAGIPSALGFRWPVSDEGASKLALTFYESLLKQGSPEIALWKARRKLAGANRNDPTWLSPILIHQV